MWKSYPFAKESSSLCCIVVDMAILCRNPTVNHLRSLLVRNPSQMKWTFLCWTPTLPGGNGPVHNSQQILLRSLRRAPCPSRVSPPFLAITYSPHNSRVSHFKEYVSSECGSSTLDLVQKEIPHCLHIFSHKDNSIFLTIACPTSCPLRISKAMPSFMCARIAIFYFHPYFGSRMKNRFLFYFATKYNYFLICASGNNDRQFLLLMFSKECSLILKS